MEKNKEQLKIKKQLEKLFINLPANKKELIDNLLDQVAFMRVTLDKLQENINENGVMMELATGNNCVAMKDNPCVRNYTSLISKYSQTINTLANYLPESFEKSKLEELIND